MNYKPNNHYSWQQSRNHRKKKKRRNKRPTFLSAFSAKNLILLVVALGIAGSLALLILLTFLGRTLPDPGTLTTRSVSQSTKIFDRTGENLLYEVHGEENRTLVKLAESFCGNKEDLDIDDNGIPLFALQATIAAEDRAFCTHKGFSVKGIARAVLANLRGSRVGGSTLTQQLVKNAILTTEKKYSRKIKELILSVEIERRYSKDEILQIYFNEIPYGSTNYGIQAAAQNYFGKSVTDITLSEAATLAALPQRPTAFLNNPDLLKTRRDWILSSMVDLEFITEAEAEVAVLEEIDIRPRISNIQAPHFVFYVKQLLEEEYGQRQVEEGGLKVITTLDLDKQIIAEEEVEKGVDERSERYEFSNASLVAIDPKSGQVLAMVGSKDYFDDDIDGQVNVALRLRQPGSSFKPIVYAAGFQRGYTPNTVLWDVTTEFPTVTGPYTPNNYDGKERGPLTVRKALQGSLNIPAVKMSYLVGLENTLDFATGLGYTTLRDPSNYGLSIVLGGAEVKLLEHTNTYAAFANDGIHFDPIGILSVEDSDGNVLFNWKQKDGKRVVDEQPVRQINNVLSDNNARSYVFGLNSSLQLGDRPVAAKTGTTNDARDAWLIGYTPQLAAGVWAGNNDNTQMNDKAGGSTIAAPIWKAFMQRALEDEEFQEFIAPETIRTDKTVLNGDVSGTTVIIDTFTGKLASEYTPTSYRAEKLFAEYHSILHYVQKDDPQGPVPENPSDDPQYESWEAAILDWITRQVAETGVTIEQGSAPTEVDDVHVPANFPSITIESPSNNAALSDRTIELAANASAARGITSVEFYIDGFFLGNDSIPPYQVITTIPNTLDIGFHTIKAIAYDDVGNGGSDTAGIRITSPGAGDDFTVVDPNNGQTIEKTQETFTVVLSLENPKDYEHVSVFAQKLGEISKQRVDLLMSPSSPFLTFDWTLPEEGEWILTAHAEKAGDGDLETPGIIVHVVEATNQPPAETSEDGESEPVVEESDLNPFQ